MNEEMREEFEEWYEAEGKAKPFTTVCIKDKMLDSWQASREAMKPIKLPCATFETPSGDNAFSEDDVIEAIQQAGYEVEE